VKVINTDWLEEEALPINAINPFKDANRFEKIVRGQQWNQAFNRTSITPRERRGVGIFCDGTPGHGARDACCAHEKIEGESWYRECR
jgi:hypothetical protein